MKYLLALFILGQVGFCTRDCGTPKEEVSFLSDSTMNNIPYQDLSSFTMLHSSGTEIKYEVSKNKRQESYSCDHCCGSYQVFDQVDVFVQPQYPTFRMRISVTSEVDSSFNYSLLVGETYFSLSSASTENLVDSLFIQNQVFKNVFAFKSNVEEGMVYPDSVYYSTQEGFLKIVMNNGEYYELKY